MKLQTSLGRSLRSAGVQPVDTAVADLARKYAAAIDGEPEKLYLYGKLFLDVLVQMGMTPKARAGVIQPVPEKSGLDELRDRRARSA